MCIAYSCPCADLREGNGVTVVCCNTEVYNACRVKVVLNDGDRCNSVSLEVVAVT